MKCNQVFDILRRKYVALTPEEGVRQHFIHYLIEQKGYPQHLLANEVKLQVGNKTLRCDTVLYSTELKPMMIIEYKAPHIELTQQVFNQLLAYNSILNVKYLTMTNGTHTVCCRKDEDEFHFITDIPDYTDMIL
ncbi:MAG: type I restriction enzyme HsdR N-terminal domain-containing protein [Prevotella sp.]|nr:type I restriction enzyme HsdR N-terminal domain-containing protein [Candidatus Equicola stercoris]